MIHSKLLPESEREKEGITGEDLALNKDIGWFNERFVSNPWTHAVLHLRLQQHTVHETPGIPATLALSRGDRRLECPKVPVLGNQTNASGLLLCVDPVQLFPMLQSSRVGHRASHPALMSAAHNYQNPGGLIRGNLEVLEKIGLFLESEGFLRALKSPLKRWNFPSSGTDRYNAVNGRGSVSEDRDIEPDVEGTLWGLRGCRRSLWGYRRARAGLATRAHLAASRTSKQLVLI